MTSLTIFKLSSSFTSTGEPLHFSRRVNIESKESLLVVKFKLVWGAIVAVVQVLVYVVNTDSRLSLYITVTVTVMSFSSQSMIIICTVTTNYSERFYDIMQKFILLW